ncbi:MAG: ABC transporter ATP-binding protein [Anaerovoracaceae bacterium]|jgi:putative ABC transport system permease protein
MLQLRHISKTYAAGDLVQKALDDISIGFRDHEFVTVLGPSGSGKTTLLNVIGGLDRYDSGELLCDGVSTRQYRDRDWDSYRNHTIGFVFQSYNLIPHQTVLANVEIALTISGVSREERRRRAVQALRDVGLEDQMPKLPNQLSGGQMQRVAIARALVNDPRVLLADEPTGALDSGTSEQVMDLLKEVSRDRLVIMVSHDAELSRRYATRIVQIRDGRVVADSAPPEAEEGGRTARDPAAVIAPAAAASGRKRFSRTARTPRTSMSFAAALALSLRNLWSKKGRTILVAAAGSVGIIGIALILALSNGVNDYIRQIEEGTILQYPVQIERDSIDFSAYMPSDEENSKAERSPVIRQDQIIRRYAGGLGSNDLRSFRAYLKKPDCGINRFARAVEYSYGVTPQIYLQNGGRVRQVCPEECLSTLNAAGYTTFELQMINLQSFYELPQNTSLYRGEYTVRAGHWPRSRRECVVVLQADGSVTDTTLYALGMKNPHELDRLVRGILYNSSDLPAADRRTWRCADFIGRSMKVGCAADKYRYDQKNGV